MDVATRWWCSTNDPSWSLLRWTWMRPMLFCDRLDFRSRRSRTSPAGRAGSDHWCGVWIKIHASGSRGQWMPLGLTSSHSGIPSVHRPQGLTSRRKSPHLFAHPTATWTLHARQALYRSTAAQYQAVPKYLLRCSHAAGQASLLRAGHFPRAAGCMLGALLSERRSYRFSSYCWLMPRS